MKKLFILPSILLFCLTAWAAEPEFRNAHWEESKKQVTASEKAPLELVTHDNEKLKRLETLRGDAKAFGFDCALRFFFVDDKLATGTYTFTQTHKDNSKYLEDYKKVERMLEEEYGSASPSPLSFENVKDPFKNDPAGAIAAGALLYQTHREIKTEEGQVSTRVVHMLSSSDGPQHRVIYSHPELSQLQTDIIRESQK